MFKQRDPTVEALTYRRFFTMEDFCMLWTIFTILVVLWLLGLVSGYTLNGFIHLLLVLAIATVLIRVIQGKKPL